MENKTNQEIINKLTAIESLLEATHETKPLTLLEAAKFLNLSQSHRYKLTSERKISHFKRQAARRFILTSLSLYSGLNATLPEHGKKQKKKRQAILFPEEELYET